MQYNVCQICGAKDGRAGLLIGGPNKPHACRNCHDTRESGEIVIHANLIRTQEEIQKTFAILKQKSMTPSYFASNLFLALKNVEDSINIVKHVMRETSDEYKTLVGLKESFIQKIEPWIDIKAANEHFKKNELVLYVVRNSKGQYFRAKGFSGSGDSWVDDINKAKIYGKIGGARSTVTYFAQNPKYPVPDIVKLGVTGMEVIDETARVKKVLDKKAKEEQEREAINAKRQLEEAKARLASAQAELKRLEKNK